MQLRAGLNSVSCSKAGSRRGGSKSHGQLLGGGYYPGQLKLQAGWSTQVGACAGYGCLSYVRVQGILGACPVST